MRAVGGDGAEAAAVEDYTDRLNQQITDELRLSGAAFVTTTQVQDRTAIRLSICSHRTTPADIDATFEALRTHGERIDAENREEIDSRWSRN